MEIAACETADKTDAIDLAFCRATLYSALALAFRPPTNETVARIIEPENSAALAAAAALIDSDGKMNLAGAIDALAAAGRAAVSTLASSYRALFGHTARGIVAPYETEYGNEALFQQPQELGDLMGFYHAFGLTTKNGTRERPDHISCEFEFLMFLALKEAYALEQDDREMLGEIRKAQRLFLGDHVGRFLPSFATKLTREDPSRFYSMLAELCLRFVTAECARLQVPLGSANLSLRPSDDSRVPMACGSGTECVAMPGAGITEGADSL
jgi:DMSO reductase family type II enzyme chaperone